MMRVAIGQITVGIWFAQLIGMIGQLQHEVRSGVFQTVALVDDPIAAGLPNLVGTRRVDRGIWSGRGLENAIRQQSGGGPGGSVAMRHDDGRVEPAGTPIPTCSASRPACWETVSSATSWISGSRRLWRAAAMVPIGQDHPVGTSVLRINLRQPAAQRLRVRQFPASWRSSVKPPVNATRSPTRVTVPGSLKSAAILDEVLQIADGYDGFKPEPWSCRCQQQFPVSSQRLLSWPFS